MNSQEMTQRYKRMGVMMVALTIMGFLSSFDDEEDQKISESSLMQIMSLVVDESCTALSAYDRKRSTTDRRDENDISEQGNPQPKRRSVSKWDWNRARQCVYDDYMRPDPIFKDRQFERTFRITRSVMQQISLTLGNMDDFFTDKICVVTGKKTICPNVKILCALKQLAYGISPHAFLDYFQMGESTARACLLRFAQCITTSDELLQRFFRPMNRTDAQNVCQLHKDVHGIDGMVGSLDCMHVTWKNCPVAWQGQYEGKEEGPTMVLEAMCDHNLYFWHHEFGSAGTLNDISIWDMSGLHKAFVDGTWTDTIDFPFTIDGQVFDKLWVTVDGIYPQIGRFVKTLSQPVGQAEQDYASWQEKTRKDVERGFGVLQAKFRFLVHKIELWSIQDIVNVVNCCLLLHNWMVTIRVSRNEPESDSWYDTLMDETASQNGENGNNSGANGDSGENEGGMNLHGDDSGENGDSSNDDSNANDDETVQEAPQMVQEAPAQEQNSESQSDQLSDEYQLLHRNLVNVRTKLINDRWIDLYDVNNFRRLQLAIINELSRKRTRNQNNSSEE
jgi:hypothetical protein